MYIDFERDFLRVLEVKFEDFVEFNTVVQTYHVPQKDYYLLFVHLASAQERVFDSVEYLDVWLAIVVEVVVNPNQSHDFVHVGS